MSHWGKYLPWAGRPVKRWADEISYDQDRLRRMMVEAQDLLDSINKEESAFLQMVQKDWSAEEIQGAKEKASTAADIDYSAKSMQETIRQILNGTLVSIAPPFAPMYSKKRP